MKEKNVEVNNKMKGVRLWLINQVINNRIFVLMIVTLIVIIIMLVKYTDTFFTYQNFGTLMLNLSTTGILSVGMMFLIVGGVFDLSIGANLALGAAVAAYILNNFLTVPIPIAMFAGILASTFIGLVNGLVVTKLRVDALITTLGMMSICRAIAIIITGSGLSNFPDSFKIIGQSVFLGLQAPVYYLALVILIGLFLLKKVGYFRKLYYIGENKIASILSGINVDKIMLTVFVIMGMLAGYTGIIVPSRLNASCGTMMGWTNLQVIAAVVIGGGSLAGGRGSIFGAFLGALFMAIIRNAMVLSGLSIYLQSAAIGFILIAVLYLNAFLSKKYGGVKV